MRSSRHRVADDTAPVRTMHLAPASPYRARPLDDQEASKLSPSARVLLGMIAFPWYTLAPHTATPAREAR